MIKSITFENYKAFGSKETLELRPITVLVGKNSSGKTSICRLFPLLELLFTGSNKYCDSRHTITSKTFHKAMLSGLEFTVTQDDNSSITTDFLVDKGVVYVRSIIFKSAHPSDQKGFSFEDRINKPLESFDFVSYFKSQQSDVSPFVPVPLYIGPVREQMENNVITYTQNKTIGVGQSGAGAYQMLISSYRGDNKLLNSVSKWLDINLEGQTLDINSVAGLEQDYTVNVNHYGVGVPIKEVGQGLSQVLPIITQAFSEIAPEFTVIEQPELHLHPAAHASVAECLAISAKERGRKYVVETHSENFLLGLRKMVSDPNTDFSPNDVIIYFVETDEEGSFLKKIEILENGELTQWPTGVFGESFDLLNQIKNNKR